MFARAQISSSRCQSALFLANRETSSPITMPAPAEADIRHELSKPLSPRRRRAGLALVGIDHDDSILGPAERSCSGAQTVLTLRALDVLENLLHRGLPDVEVRGTIEVM